jgi:hypothetical protein
MTIPIAGDHHTTHALGASRAADPRALDRATDGPGARSRRYANVRHVDVD